MEHGKAQAAAGAAIIDVGGIDPPGAAPVAVEEACPHRSRRDG